MTPKIYECIKCHKECDPQDMVRITVSSYGTGKYKQWYQDVRYDMCNECYSRLLAPWWRRPLKKHNTMKGGGSNE